MDRLNKLEFFSLEKRRLQGDLLVLKGETLYKKAVDRHFSWACCNRARVNSLKIFRLEIRKKMFYSESETLAQVAQRGDRCPIQVRLYGALSNLI